MEDTSEITMENGILKLYQELWQLQQFGGRTLNVTTNIPICKMPQWS
jgi:hypothetical protein